MRKIILLLAIILMIIDVGCERANKQAVKVKWAEDLQGDFEFRHNWSYPEGVFMNEFGQLSCDGLCPQEIETMKDENGRIFDDSVNRFYQLVDTSHRFYSIQSETNSYEWMGTNFIDVDHFSDSSLFCSTVRNIATHSSLSFMFDGEYCFPTIHYHSVASSKVMVFNCNSGEIIVDTNFWNQGILKAEFNFKFENTEEPEKEFFWKGKIYTSIE